MARMESSKTTLTGCLKEGTKQTKESKEFWESEENENAYEMCGDPAESTDQDLLAWAGDTHNQHQRRLLVESIASLSDDVLLQSYVDGQFLVDLKKRARSGIFQQMFSSATAKNNSDNCFITESSTVTRR